MKKILSFMLSATALFLLSCASMQYTQIGKTYPALPETETVDIVLRARPDYKVEQIGMVRVYDQLEYQIDNLKKITRQHGGNVAILVELGYDQNYQMEYRTFEIARKTDK